MQTQYIAKHKAVYSELRQMILEGRLAAGERIPPDDGLAAKFQCGRGTVRRAIQSLVEEGLLRGQQGSGTYVQTRPREAFIGIIVPNLINPDHSQLVSAVTAAAAMRGYTALLAVVEQGREGYERIPIEWQFIEKMGRMHVAGLVKCPTEIPIENDFRQRLSALNVPFVIVNDFWSDGSDANHILVDERVAVRLVVDHLAGLGHERIGYFTYDGLNRRKFASAAFAQTLEGHNLSRNFIYEVDYDNLAERISRMNESERPTAIIAPYSPDALGLIDDFEKAGLRVPDDISIASLDNVPVPAPTRLDLTSTIVPMDVLADQLLNMLLAGSGATACQSKARYLYAPTLHLGNTTAKPRSGTGGSRGSVVAVRY